MESESKQKQPLRKKHLPERTCIACREVKAKRELVRIVRTPNGTVELDPSGKKAGRGAYLCNTRRCWELGLKGNHLEHALRAKIAPENRLKLLEYAERLPQG